MRDSRGMVVGIIVIILGILVALFMIGFFTENRPFGLGNYRSILNLPCGLTVNTPKPDASVSFPLTVGGYANGCGWEDIDGSVGSIDVLDSNGVVYAHGLLPIVGTVAKPYYFEISVAPALPAGITAGTIVFNSNSGAAPVLIPFSIK